MVRKEDALTVELRDVGTQKNGQYRKRMSIYTFRCVLCPNTFEAAKYDLKRVSGKCRKCSDRATGLLSSLRNRIRPYEALYNKFVYDRHRFKQTTNLSYEDFVALAATTQCVYCGASVFWAEYGLEKNGSRYNLDRKDSTKGYSKDNVVVCCWLCNETKSNRFTYEQFLKIGEVLRTFH